MKTEFMCLNEVKIKSLDGTKIKQVQQFTYLGTQISFSNQEYKEVLVRKKNMWSAYHIYKKKWKKLKDKDKRKLAVQILFSIATYGAQAWQLLKNISKQLQGTINHIWKCLNNNDINSSKLSSVEDKILKLPKNVPIQILHKFCL
uniref:Uncharacterized protein n=1 Tax=Strongyloides venezuelensis TaxID=75913 RepID=A0A0K0F1V4_STRVS